MRNKFKLISLFALICTSSFAQNVGIGVLVPTGKLEVATTSTVPNPTVSLYDFAADNYARLQFQTGSRSSFWQIAGLLDNTIHANSKLNFYHSNYGNVMLLTGDGKVGIGMTPVEKFDVAGNARANSFQFTIARPFYYSASGPDFQPIISAQSMITDEKLISILGINGTFTNGSAMVASLHLPHGAIINDFTAYFTDNSTEDIKIQLLEYNPVTDVTLVVGEVSSSGTPNKSFQTTNNILVNPINNKARAYKILVRTVSNNPMPDSALAIRSVNITYLLTEAQ